MRVCRYELPRYIVRFLLETHSIRVEFFGGTIFKQLCYIGLLRGAFWRRGFPGHFSKARPIHLFSLSGTLFCGALLWRAPSQSNLH